MFFFLLKPLYRSLGMDGKGMDGKGTESDVKLFVGGLWQNLDVQAIRKYRLGPRQRKCYLPRYSCYAHSL